MAAKFSLDARAGRDSHEKAGITNWVAEQQRRKWRWAGNVARQKDGRWTTAVLDWRPLGDRPRGYSPSRRTDDFVAFCESLGKVFGRSDTGASAAGACSRLRHLAVASRRLHRPSGAVAEAALDARSTSSERMLPGGLRSPFYSLVFLSVVYGGASSARRILALSLVPLRKTWEIKAATMKMIV